MAGGKPNFFQGLEFQREGRVVIEGEEERSGTALGDWFSTEGRCHRSS